MTRARCCGIIWEHGALTSARPCHDCPRGVAAARPMLVGEAPRVAGWHALDGAAGDRLATYAGLASREGLLGAFDARNLHGAPVDRWSAPVARDAARLLLEERPAVVVCLGRRVQRAVGGALDFPAARLWTRRDGGWGGVLFGSFGVWAAPWHVRTPTVPAGATEAAREWAPWLVTVPHPSGLNRHYNDPVARERAGRALREALELAAAGDDAKYPSAP